jgi:hypothetical protein
MAYESKDILAVFKNLFRLNIFSAPCPVHLAPSNLKEFELFLAGFLFFFIFGFRRVIFFEAVFDVA